MESEQRALLDAILRDPDDDIVRLVYADYLDERAQPHPCGCAQWAPPAYTFCPQCKGTGVVPKNQLHAELIRVQIALARGPGGPDRDALRKRQAELEDKGAYWVVHDPIIYPVGLCVGVMDGPHPKIHIRRGFVRRWEMSVDQWLAHHQQILSAHPIEEIVFNRFGDYHNQTNDLVWLRGMPQLRTVPRNLGRCVYTLCTAAYWPRIKFSCTPRAHDEIHPELPLAEPVPDP